MESYLLKSSIFLLVFYLLYRVILYHEANSQIKRFVGLACVLFSSSFFLMPSLNLVPVEFAPVVIQKVVETSSAIQSNFSTTLPKDSMSTFLLVYLIGVGVFALRFAAGAFSLAQLYRSSEKMHGWGFTVVATSRKISPFTLFTFLFIQKEDLQRENIHALIEHEQVHRDQRHTIDTIILQLFTILFWFHPAMWLFQKDIKAQHEFLADEEVLKKGFDKLDYQHMLFEEQTGVSFQSVNYLSNKTSLKQRFNMMEKPKFNTKSSYFKAALFFPLMAIAVLISSFSPALVEDYESSTSLQFNVFTQDGKVDLKNGIPKSTTQLFIRAEFPKEGEIVGVKVSKTETTLISGGLGRGTIRAGENISVETLLSALPDGEECQLILEVSEYLTKGANDVVETVKLEEPIAFTIPVN